MKKIKLTVSRAAQVGEMMVGQPAGTVLTVSDREADAMASTGQAELVEDLGDDPVVEADEPAGETSDDDTDPGLPSEPAGDGVEPAEPETQPAEPAGEAAAAKPAAKGKAKPKPTPKPKK